MSDIVSQFIADNATTITSVAGVLLSMLLVSFKTRKTSLIKKLNQENKQLAKEFISSDYYIQTPTGQLFEFQDCKLIEKEVFKDVKKENE